MLKKDLLANTKEIWCGLNRPDLGIDHADMTVFGIPYDSEFTGRTGTSKAPSVLREASKISSPFNENFECFNKLNIYDAGDFVRQESINEYFEAISNFTKKLVKNDKFFIMIGGDHSTTIPVLTGIDKAMTEDFGIIYIGAHFDLHDNKDGDKYSSSTVARRAFELENITGAENICFIGTRTIDEEEYNYKVEHDIKCLNSVLCHRIESDRIGTIAAKQLKKFKKVYITLDIDCLDPAYAAGVCYPQFAGLYARQLLNILTEIFKSLDVIGLDIVGMAPDLDPSLASTFAARKIFQEVCGHCARKLGKLDEEDYF